MRSYVFHVKRLLSKCDANCPFKWLNRFNKIVPLNKSRCLGRSRDRAGEPQPECRGNLDANTCLDRDVLLRPLQSDQDLSLLLNGKLGHEGPTDVRRLRGRVWFSSIAFDHLLLFNVFSSIELRLDIWANIHRPSFEKADSRVDVRVIISIDCLEKWLRNCAWLLRPGYVPENVLALLHLTLRIDLHH